MLNSNQFAQSPIQGMLDLRFNGQTISGQVDSGELIAGQPVKMVDSLGGVPKFVACALDSDDVFGFVNYSIKDQKFKAGSSVEVSALRGNVMYMTASAAIARNAPVAIVVAGCKVVTAAAGKMVVGRAFDKAAGDGSLIRVVIDLPGALVPALIG